jgi:hypothetical protein
LKKTLLWEKLVVNVITTLDQLVNVCHHILMKEILQNLKIKFILAHILNMNIVEYVKRILMGQTCSVCVHCYGGKEFKCQHSTAFLEEHILKHPYSHICSNWMKKAY